MENSKIEWTDNTWNLWRGCTEVSPACDHCYAREVAKRNPAVLGQWGAGAPRVLGNEIYRRAPLKWNAQAEKEGVRRRVFALSMGDWLDDEVPAAWLAELLEMVYATPRLDWQLLTKRPGNFKARLGKAILAELEANGFEESEFLKWLWHWEEGVPPHNVWVGTTVEDQARAEERVPHLLAIPARVRFLSCEPLLGPVELRTIEDSRGVPALSLRYPASNRIHWVIAGGESGAKARPMHPEWVCGLRDQCGAVPFFFKQWGEYEPATLEVCESPMRFVELSGEDSTQWTLDRHSAGTAMMCRTGKKKAGRMLDGREWSQFPTVSES